MDWWTVGSSVIHLSVPDAYVALSTMELVDKGLTNKWISMNFCLFFQTSLPMFPKICDLITIKMYQNQNQKRCNNLCLLFISESSKPSAVPPRPRVFFPDYDHGHQPPHTRISSNPGYRHCVQQDGVYNLLLPTRIDGRKKKLETTDSGSFL